MSNYAVNEADAAVLTTLAAILNADVEGMKALNLERQNRGYALGYDEGSFHDAGQELRDYLECLKVVEK